MIEYICKQCKAQLETNDSMGTKTESCPNCSTVNEVPMSKGRCSGTWRKRILDWAQKQQNKETEKANYEKQQEQERQKQERQRQEELERQAEQAARVRGQPADVPVPTAYPSVIEEVFSWLGVVAVIGGIILGAVGLSNLAEKNEAGVLLLVTGIALALSSIFFFGGSRALEYLRRITFAAENKSASTPPPKNTLLTETTVATPLPPPVPPAPAARTQPNNP